MQTYTLDALPPNDFISLIILEEALAAVQEGNFGIGACLVWKDAI
jgi:hypothetical protein